jgi:hypothetical protein
MRVLGARFVSVRDGCARARVHFVRGLFGIDVVSRTLEVTVVRIKELASSEYGVGVYLNDDFFFHSFLA